MKESNETLALRSNTLSEAVISHFSDQPTNLIFFRKECSVSNCCSERSSTLWFICFSGSRSDTVRSLENVVTCRKRGQAWESSDLEAAAV